MFFKTYNKMRSYDTILASQKLLNVFTLVQHQNDNINRMITINKPTIVFPLHKKWLFFIHSPNIALFDGMNKAEDKLGWNCHFFYFFFSFFSYFFHFFSPFFMCHLYFMALRGEMEGKRNLKKETRNSRKKMLFFFYH